MQLMIDTANDNAENLALAVHFILSMPGVAQAMTDVVPVVPELPPLRTDIPPGASAMVPRSAAGSVATDEVDPAKVFGKQTESWIAPQPPAPPAPPADEPQAMQFEFDAVGTPWIETVHSSAKSKNADGTWRLRKGVAKSTAAATIAHYKALIAKDAPAGVSLPQSSAVPVPPPPPPQASGADLSAGSTVPVPPPPPIGAVSNGASASVSLPAAPSAGTASVLPGATPVAPPLSPEASTFRDVMRLIMSGKNSGKLTDAECDGVLAQVGVPNFQALVPRPQLVPAVLAAVQAIINSKG